MDPPPSVTWNRDGAGHWRGTPSNMRAVLYVLPRDGKWEWQCWRVGIIDAHGTCRLLRDAKAAAVAALRGVA
jgi:hypothetical protein